MIVKKEKKINPLVSIITPSYNCGHYIEQTIKSIKNQDYPNIQHIIIDGGSNDNTLEILEKYNEEITWISEPDSGMYDAINKGFALAKGDIYTYINTDDIYNSTSVVSSVAEALCNDDSISFTYGHCTFVDSSGNFMYTYKAPRFFKEYSIAFPRGTFAQPTCFWRKDVHVDFDSSLQYVADSKFFRYLCENFKGKRINKVIAKFKIREDCLTFQNLEDLQKEDSLIYKDKNQHPTPLRFILFDIFYRVFFLNFRTNIKRKVLQYKGEPYL
jgi:glycosyltransferase involved in cell wall biosynthesis